MLKIYVDAATRGNPGPSGGGIVYITEATRKQLHIPLATLTNHEAEFSVLIQALQLVIKNQENQQTVVLHSDSKTVIETLEKNFTRNEAFQPYLKEFKQLEQQFPLLLLKWVPESQNKGADQLAKQALRKFHPHKKSGT